MVFLWGHKSKSNYDGVTLAGFDCVKCGYSGRFVVVGTERQNNVYYIPTGAWHNAGGARVCPSCQDVTMLSKRRYRELPISSSQEDLESLGRELVTQGITPSSSTSAGRAGSLAPIPSGPRCRMGHPNEEAHKFCSTCGSPLVNACPNGHECPAHHDFCGECGERVIAAESEDAEGATISPTPPTTARTPIRSAQQFTDAVRAIDAAAGSLLDECSIKIAPYKVVISVPSHLVSRTRELGFQRLVAETVTAHRLPFPVWRPYDAG